MALNFQLPAEIETALRRQAEAAGTDVDALVTGVVAEAIAEDSRCLRPADSDLRSTERFRERLERCTALHPGLDHRIDDSRESIYDAARSEV